MTVVEENGRVFLVSRGVAEEWNGKTNLKGAWWGVAKATWVDIPESGPVRDAIDALKKARIK